MAKRIEGCRILYVGGHQRHSGRLKSMVEGLGGIFNYHDGGVERSIARLKKQITGADVIFFPPDTIGHSAQDAVKEACRNTDKRYVPLRSHSISAFVQALEEQFA